MQSAEYIQEDEAARIKERDEDGPVLTDNPVCWASHRSEVLVGVLIKATALGTPGHSVLAC